jgi:hypothetical protein
VYDSVWLDALDGHLLLGLVVLSQQHDAKLAAPQLLNLQEKTTFAVQMFE